MNNEIKVDYPRTKYKRLNEKIKDEITLIIQEFMEYAKETVQVEFPYALDVSYEFFVYDSYLSYAFFATFDVGGAHPDHRIFTITYDTKNDSFITMENLSHHAGILEILSLNSREALSKYPAIMEFQMEDMLLEGTQPVVDNFKNFVLTPQGIVIFFERYQVAPYAAGSFKVMIPYRNFSF